MFCFRRAIKSLDSPWLSPLQSEAGSPVRFPGTPMPRSILDENHIHPVIRDTVAQHHQSVVQAVQSALASHAVVVVGMKSNPVVGKARALLASAGMEHHYMEYGSYLSQWRVRNALKMWTGWPTFPMVFVKGMLIGGFDDLKALHDAGQLRDLLG